ncbi:voltage-gated potassium channel protein [Enterovibrio paralichthyis]|uniref:voltage-gated potassium channel protein n=1 Tax=Enterovibrio paralichthyis TaxID=2853805 RepID=UPI0021040ED3|nr:voltage-gated potassium channel protein [Enterovibrio paralichthyis]
MKTLTWQQLVSMWQYLRHFLVAIVVFITGFLIFRSVWGDNVNLLSLFQIKTFKDINWSDAANGPWLLLGLFLMLNAVGLLFRARIAWAVTLILLMIVFTFTWHFFSHLGINIYWASGAAILLILMSKDFNRSSATAGGIAAFISFAVLLFYSTYGAMYFGDGFKPVIEDLSTAFYFSMVTMTTVGYGDITPQTEAARLFTVSVIVAGITVFATSLTTVFAPIISGGLSRLVRGVKKPMNRKNHFIVCGTSVLASATVLQLIKRGFDVTVITVEDEDKFTQIEQRIGAKLDIVSGDSTDSDVLTDAGVEDCQAVLALTNDDATNAFIVLSVKAISPNIKAVTAVNDAKNIKKVKRVNADVLLAPQLFGSVVLASVLSGEPISNDQLLDMLLHSGEGLMKKD